MDQSYSKIVIAGHVDHGKSTLVGRLLSDTNQVFPERVAKVKNICEQNGKKFEFAFLLDAFEEEQKEGITIDKTEIPWNYQGKEFLIIDTPGHKEFLKNMISGASTAETAMIMLDAEEGIKEQFKRHSYIVGMLGIKNIIVVVNKMDLISYSEEKFKSIETQVLKIYSELKIKADQIIPVSAFLGENLLTKSEKLKWFKGLTLADALVKVSAQTKVQNKDLRFSLQDVYKFDEKRIYAGKVESGCLSIGDEIKFLPSGSVSKIRSIESWNTSTPVLHAETGDSTGFTLADPLFLERGEIGYKIKETPPAVTFQIHASLFWMSSAPLTPKKSYIFKMATQEAECKIETIFSVFNPQTFDDETPKAKESLRLDNGEAGEIIIKFQKNIVCDTFGEFPNTGRFVLLDNHRILGGGVILSSNTIQVFKESSELTTLERAKHYGHEGAVLWLTGLSGAGKSTIAKQLEKKLFLMNAKTLILDGDNIRKGLCRDLGFSDEDRKENIRRTGAVAKLVADSGSIVIAALISPFSSDRELVKSQMEGTKFIEVFVKCPLEECERRDKKGLYKKARAGEIKGFTGIDSDYEAPKNPQLVIDSDKLNPEESVEKILQLLKKQNILGAKI
jgi:bifunctional enzyme CysN/CysC